MLLGRLLLWRLLSLLGLGRVDLLVLDALVVRLWLLKNKLFATSFYLTMLLKLRCLLFVLLLWSTKLDLLSLALLLAREAVY